MIYEINLSCYQQDCRAEIKSAGSDFSFVLLLNPAGEKKQEVALKCLRDAVTFLQKIFRSSSLCQSNTVFSASQLGGSDSKIGRRSGLKKSQNK